MNVIKTRSNTFTVIAIAGTLQLLQISNHFYHSTKKGVVSFVLVRGSVGVRATGDQQCFYFSNKSCSSDGI